MLKTILIIIGLLCIFLAAFNINLPRVNLGWLGVGLVGVSLLIV